MRKLLATLLTISLNAYAIPPVSVDSEVTAVGNYVQNVKLPNEQATQLTSRNTRVETGNTNLLKNPSFEHMTTGLGWTTTNATSALETSAVVDGKKSLKLTLSGALTATQDSSINAANLVGLQGVASIKIKSSNVSGLKVCARNAGVTSTSLCVNVTADGTWKHVSIPFIMTATSNGIAITSTGTSGIVYIDDAFVGTSAPFQGVSGAKLVGTVTFSGCSNWGTTSTTFANFAATTGCTITTTGSVTAPGTQIPAAVISGGAGTYQFVYSGIYGNNSNLGYTSKVRFSDGTNASAESMVGSYGANTSSTVVGQLSYSASISNTTVQMQGLTGSAGNATFIGGNIGTISVYYFPPESRIYSQNGDIVSNSTFYTAYISSTGVISNQNVPWLSSCTNATTPVCTFNSGVYSPNVSCVVNPVGGGVAGYTAVSTTTVTGYVFNSSITAISGDRVYTCYKNGNDYSNAFKPVIVGSFAGIEKCANDYECTDEFVANIGSGGVVTNENVDWINGNCVNSPTGYYTCTYNSNLKNGASALSSPMVCNVTPSLNYQVSIESLASTTQTSFEIRNSTGGVANSSSTIKCSKGANDYKPKTAKVATSIGVPTVPGITTAGTGNAIDTFSFSYGTTNATTNCTASPCSYLDQIGNIVSSVTRSTNGNYTLNLNKTYLKLKCSGSVLATGVGAATLDNVTCSTPCSSVALTTRNVTNAGADTNGTIYCQGSY